MREAVHEGTGYLKSGRGEEVFGAREVAVDGLTCDMDGFGDVGDVRRRSHLFEAAASCVKYSGDRLLVTRRGAPSPPVRSHHPRSGETGSDRSKTIHMSDSVLSGECSKRSISPTAPSTPTASRMR